MIKYTDFNFAKKAKPSYGKQRFTLTAEQLSFLCLISEKFNISDEELKLIEFLVYNECRMVSLNRFRQLDYEAVCLAAVLYVFDMNNRDYRIIQTNTKQVPQEAKHTAYIEICSTLISL